MVRVLLAFKTCRFFLADKYKKSYSIDHNIKDILNLIKFLK